MQRLSSCVDIQKLIVILFFYLLRKQMKKHVKNVTNLSKFHWQMTDHILHPLLSIGLRRSTIKSGVTFHALPKNIVKVIKDVEHGPFVEVMELHRPAQTNRQKLYDMIRHLFHIFNGIWTSLTCEWSKRHKNFSKT